MLLIATAASSVVAEEVMVRLSSGAGGLGAVGAMLLALFVMLLVALVLRGKRRGARRKKDVEKSKGKKSDKKWNPPSGPKPFPILGSLHLLGKHEIAFEAFTELSKEYGDIFNITLGTTECVVLNNPELRDEALLTKGNDFDGRPNFQRFIRLFGNEKQHSLAFCDWDQVQSHRREILQQFTLPHSHSSNWKQLDLVCQEECSELVSHVSNIIAGEESAVVDLRPLIMKSCANIFNRYFCATRRYDYDETDFASYVENFDKIFLEVNTGRLPDFIPSLTPMSMAHIYKSKENARCVRRFVDDVIITSRKEDLTELGEDQEEGKPNTVFLDAIMPYLDGTKRTSNSDGSYTFDRESALYALEDILGGFAAVGCMTTRFVKDLADNSAAQEAVAAEAIEIEAENEGAAAAHALASAAELHWARAAMFESVRLTCSPIVPHRATRDSTIGGFDIKKDTVVFINNHHMSFDEKYWGEGDTSAYLPERFLKQTTCSKGNSGYRFLRPKHFKPFSQGKRSCMGYKLVENVCLAVTVALVRAFRMETADNTKIPPGILATPIRSMNMRVSNRNSN